MSSLLTTLVNRDYGNIFYAYLRSITAGDLLEHPDIRPIVNVIPVIAPAAKQDNPHGLAAAVRSAADDHITKVAALLNKPIYSISGSKKDGYRGVLMSRLLYDSKDLVNYNTKVDTVPDGAIYKMVDVDSHPNEDAMRTLLLTRNITAFYTWMPTAPAGTSAETAFRYDQESARWLFRHAGAEYSHNLWDYSGHDVISATRLTTRDTPYVVLGLAHIGLGLAGLVRTSAGAIVEVCKYLTDYQFCPGNTDFELGISATAPASHLVRTAEHAAQAAWRALYSLRDYLDAVSTPVDYIFDRVIPRLADSVEPLYEVVSKAVTVRPDNFVHAYDHINELVCTERAATAVQYLDVEVEAGYTAVRSNWKGVLLAGVASLAAVGVGIMLVTHLKTVVRQVHVTQVEEHRVVVWTTPKRELGTLASLLWYNTLQQDRLKRVTPDVLRFADKPPIMSMITYGQPDGPRFAYSPDGTYVSTVLNNEQHATVVGAMRTSDKVSSGVVAMSLERVANIKLAPANLVPIMEAIKHTTHPSCRQDNFIRSRDDRNGPFGPAFLAIVRDPEPGEEYKVPMRTFMSPLVTGHAVQHIRCRSTMLDAERYRLTEVENPKRIGDIPAIYFELAQEWFDLCRQHLPRQRLVSDQEVFDNLKRPSQFAGTQEGFDYGCDPELALESTVRGDEVFYQTTMSFNKAETGTAFKDARIITTLPTSTTFMQAKLHITVGKSFKHAHWYAFGKSPADASHQVPQTAKKVRKIWLDSDYSRFDGTIGEFQRYVERGTYCAVISEEDHKQVVATHEMSITFRKNKASHGVTFKRPTTGRNRWSGEHGTTNGNCAINASTAYMALRLSTNPATGKRYTPQEAWDALGKYGGDDGGTPDLDPGIYVSTVRALGMKATISVAERGDKIFLLGRVWGPGVWQGDAANCCDMMRALDKFHTTTLGTEHSDASVARYKALSYLATESPLTIIGKLCTVIELYTRDEKEIPGYCTWSASEVAEAATPFENQYAPWMDDLIVDDFGNPLPLDDFNEWVRQHLDADEDQVAEIMRTQSFLNPPLIWDCGPPELPTNVDSLLVAEVDDTRAHTDLMLLQIAEAPDGDWAGLCGKEPEVEPEVASTSATTTTAGPTDLSGTCTVCASPTAPKYKLCKECSATKKANPAFTLPDNGTNRKARHCLGCLRKGKQTITATAEHQKKLDAKYGTKGGPPLFCKGCTPKTKSK